MRGPHYTGDINEPYVREDLALERQGELTDHIIQLQAEVARLNENVNKLNKALEQAVDRAWLKHRDNASHIDLSQAQYELMQTLVVYENITPELAAWLKENR